jgi:phage recombination protein Bet
MSNIVLAQATKLATSLGMDIGGDELVQTLKATAFKGQVSDAQMAALLIVANQYGLSPWTKEIYAFPDKNNGIVPVVGVDGWARIINEHTQFDGMDFEQDAESCTCIIYRKDRSRPVKVTEFMDECKRGTGPWQSHPRRMLRHKAMIQCARLAFGYAGIYDQDEAERIVEKDITPTSAIGKQAAAGNVNSERRDELVKAANEVAKRGDVDALRGHFKALSREDRAIIGTDIMQQLKEAAEAASAPLVIDGEFQEVGEYDDAAA